MVQAHQGAIHLRTRDGGGSVFRLFFPLSSGEMSLPVPEQVPSDAPGSGHILVIDDDIDFGDMLSIALERLGYEAGICSDPLVGLESFNETPELWDLVIVDQTMPAMQGIDVIRKIRAVNATTKIILCSGYGSGLSLEAVQQAGADLYVQKPLDLQKLSFDIAGLLDRDIDATFEGIPKKDTNLN